jgi:undecaprenyl-diphosphatase
MTLLQSIILGIVQGLTEFFPVSSSAHLRLAKWLMGVPDGEHLLYFDLICHGGTLLALILFMRKDIFAALRDRKAVGLFILALFPLIPAYFLLKPLRIAASDPAYLGYFLMFTALLLFFAARKTEVKDRGVKVKDVLCIGIMQTMALLPGISRSGSTIAAGRLLGWDWIAAARFSFLLAIPAILGGQVLETLKLFREHAAHSSLSFGCYAAGFCASFIIGMAGVRFMFKIYEKGIVRPFAWYCLSAGIFALWALHG